MLKKTKKILGVYENITIDQILEYLESNVTPKKIITTPESYCKVQQAFLELGINIYTHSFMLFDECERAIQDVGYRSKIILPMQDFFKFINKAFISATPIVPSDPNFALQNFKHVYIKPDFNIKQNLKLIDTNNIQFTLEKFISENPRKQYFVFFNSTDNIASLIDALKLRDESAIFCAKESKNKLRVNDFKHVYTDLTNFQKFNFFTSRFFSAVDIENIQHAVIIIISDLVSASHSMIDPRSEAIQIAGRFRKINGVTQKKEIIHITNIDASIISKTEQQCIEDIKAGRFVYDTIKSFRDASTSIYAREVLKEVLTRIDFAKYLNNDGTNNYFMEDNTIYEEKVKGYYQSIQNLTKGYEQSNQFIIQSFTENYKFTDFDKAKTQSSQRLKTVFEIVMPVLKDLYDSKQEKGFMYQYQLDTLKKEFPEVFKAFNELGLEEVKKLDFNHIKIRKAIKEKELKGQKNTFRVY